jgi:murein DD-endopeptidase MepM/ murein hydrolase activator NlpD
LHASMIAALLAMAAAGTAQPQSATERGRALSDWSSPESVAALAATASPELKARIDAGGGPAAFSAAVAGQMGKQTQVFDEVEMAINGLTFYQRLAAYERAPAAMSMVVWDEKGTVVAATVQPSAPPPAALSAGAGVAVRPPFAPPRQGEWFTFWGGRNLARNYHMVAPAQTYAFDLLVVKDGKSFSGPANEHASYYCWDEPVLAAADGVVTEAVDGLPDMPIGDISAKQAAGNHVIVRVGPEQHALVAHLQNGTVKVKAGDTVKAGQPLGLCGNSGRTSEPHIHFHLQAGATFADGGTGLPANFHDMLVDGRPVRDGEPVRGQSIAVAE